MRQLRGPGEHGLLRVEIDAAATLIAGERAVQTAQTRRAPGRREAHAAKARLHLEI
jgi:hypothetical protein